MITVMTTNHVPTTNTGTKRIATETAMIPPTIHSILSTCHLPLVAALKQVEVNPCEHPHR
jgi:hypothetical protein